MTLVTRSAVRLSRRGGAALKTARANAAFFNTAASSAQNVLPKFAANASRVNIKAPQGELVKSIAETTDSGGGWG
jgi:F-type H+-transporting ATPase subunit beta